MTKEASDELRDKRIDIRVRKTEKASLVAAAEAVGRSMTDYIVSLHKHKSVEFIKQFTPKPAPDKKP